VKISPSQLTFSLISLTVFLPSFVYVYLSTTSLAHGLLVTILIIFATSFRCVTYASRKTIFDILKLATFAVPFQIMAFYVTDGLITGKTVLSIFLLGAVFFSSIFIANLLVKLNFKDIKTILKKLSILLLFFGIFALIFDISLFGYGNYAKSIFPFSEPSHYALSIGPILFTTGFFLKPKYRNFLVLILFIFGVTLKSLILLVFSVFLILYYYKARYIPIFISVFLSVFFLFDGVFFDATYFIDRLSLLGGQNLSVLVYIQGWENILIALEQSYGFGVGFGNIANTLIGDTGELIYSLSGEYKNRTDGSFLASKLISEFGVFGIFLIAIYIKLFLRSSRFLKATIFANFYLNQNSQYSAIQVLSSAFIVSFSIELFIRGYGYFSPGVLIFLIALFLQGSERKT